MSKKGALPEKMKYEQAYAELEQTVKLLETGTITVDDALAGFERGMIAARRCIALLDAAESKMNMLVRELNGEIMLEQLTGEEL